MTWREWQHATADRLTEDAFSRYMRQNFTPLYVCGDFDGARYVNLRIEPEDSSGATLLSNRLPANVGREQLYRIVLDSFNGMPVIPEEYAR